MFYMKSQVPGETHADKYAIQHVIHMSTRAESTNKSTVILNRTFCVLSCSRMKCKTQLCSQSSSGLNQAQSSVKTTTERSTLQETNDVYLFWCLPQLISEWDWMLLCGELFSSSYVSRQSRLLGSDTVKKLSTYHLISAVIHADTADISVKVYREYGINK